MSYWRYWQLNSAPFSSDNIRSIFEGATVEEALARIEFLISHRRRLGTLLGASGVGKTQILRFLAANAPRGEGDLNIETCRISMLALHQGDLLSELAGHLCGRRVTTNSSETWIRICDYFAAARREDLQIGLFIDDVESASPEAEADIARLMSQAFPLTIVLGVETRLISAVSRRLLDQTELQIELPAWSEEQTAEFLAWELGRLGRKTPVFTDTAVRQIQQLSGGVARRIVQLADLALVAGAVSQSDFVDAECIDQVAWELPKSTAA